VVLGDEAGRARGLGHDGGDRLFDRGRRGEVVDAAAVGTDEVMVVASEILGQLVAREVARNEPVHRAGLLEDHEIAIHGTLRQPVSGGEDLRNRQRAVTRPQDVDDDAACWCEPLLLGMQQAGHGFVKCAVRHARSSVGGTVETMDAVERFTAAVAADPADVRLDVAAFCIAQCAHPDLDIDDACVRLDLLASECEVTTFDGVRSFLFGEQEFVGNVNDYGDPENSFLDAVLDRRTGIPITLAILMMEVARRRGVVAHGVGMPGHFLVQDPERDSTWCDPFHGGVLLDVDDCRELFRRVHGTTSQFSRALLVPTSAHRILARMLTNLEHGRLANESANVEWIAQMQLALPGLPDAERARLKKAVRMARSRWN
jgi:regulator of sirC expression with transglutaminase-like and TPR domain